MNKLLKVCLHSILFLVVATLIASASPTPVPTPSAEPKGLHIVAACSRGFEEAVPGSGPIEFKRAEDEEFCLSRSLCLFRVAMQLTCEKLLPGEAFRDKDVPTYDLNKNGKVDCEDYKAWKLWLVDKSISGRTAITLETINKRLSVKECE
jgi:hypothetical protein